MNPLIKHWQYVLVAIFLVISIFSIVTNIANTGQPLNYGIDFNGGTLYQVELQKQVSGEEIARIANIISQRIDPGGLRGDSISPVGGKYLMIQTAETNPIELEKIESRIRQQGKFESTLNGEVLFTGDEIKKVQRKDGYGVAKIGTYYEWNLPFILNETAAKRFAEKTFHQCTAISFTSAGKPVYECERTTFFLDKPNATILISEEQFDFDEQELLLGNTFINVPAETSITEVIEDSRINVVTYSTKTGLDKNALSAALSATEEIIVSPDIFTSVKSELETLGFTVSTEELKENEPWIWNVMNARQIIRLSEGITNEDVANVSQAKIYSQLNISGTRENAAVAFQDLEELAILLESGSLPTPVKSISKETISPALGKSFLDNIVLMGIIALIIVAGVIIIRYRNLTLAAPVIATILSEIIILLGLLSLPFIKQPFDLAAFAGVIAALGTGVDAEIVIIDELTNKAKRQSLSLFQRIKKGLFIITTSALTIIAVMGPIVLFSRSMPGLSNLYGFAIVAILGALIGVLITRPAFTKTIEIIMERSEKEEKKN